jgi:hypothetical protein
VAVIAHSDGIKWCRLSRLRLNTWQNSLEYWRDSSTLFRHNRRRFSSLTANLKEAT